MKYFARITTAEGKSSRTPNAQHLSTGLAGCSRYDVRNVELREVDSGPSRTTVAPEIRA